jgi:hypothetical protein
MLKFIRKEKNQSHKKQTLYCIFQDKESKSIPFKAKTKKLRDFILKEKKANHENLYNFTDYFATQWKIIIDCQSKELHIREREKEKKRASPFEVFFSVI